MLTDEEFEGMYQRATERGEARLRSIPCAVAVRYDANSQQIVIDLTSGCSLHIPPQIVQGLAKATNTELRTVRILGPGTTIFWPKLDLHFSVEGLLEGITGSQAWMKSLSMARTSKPRIPTKGSRSSRPNAGRSKRGARALTQR